LSAAQGAVFWQLRCTADGSFINPRTFARSQGF
jgi:hypothetical protein